MYGLNFSDTKILEIRYDVVRSFLVSDVMTKDPVCIPAYSKLAEAAYVITRNGISGYQSSNLMRS